MPQGYRLVNSNITELLWCPERFTASRLSFRCLMGKNWKLRKCPDYQRKRLLLKHSKIQASLPTSSKHPCPRCWTTMPVLHHRWCWVLSSPSPWRSLTSMKGQDGVALTSSHEQPGKQANRHTCIDLLPQTNTFKFLFHVLKNLSAALFLF